MKVYVAIAGSYSDTSVTAVFSDKQAASKCGKALDWAIEEYELDAFDTSQFPEGKSSFCAHIRVNARRVESVWQIDRPPEGWRQLEHYTTPGSWFGSFWAVDIEEAKQIARAKLEELLNKGGGSAV